MKKIISVFLIFLTISCQTSKVIFQNTDFKKVAKYRYEEIVLGELDFIVNFEEAYIKEDVFFGKGYIYCEDTKENISNVVISIKKDKKKNLLYTTNEDGKFKVKIKNLSAYDRLEFKSPTYTPMYFDIRSLLQEKGLIEK